MKKEYFLIILYLVLIAADIISGIIKGISEKDLKSSILRDGFFKKISALLVLSVVYLVNYGLSQYTELNIDIFSYSCVYLIFMEIISVVENASLINPSLKTLFEKIKEKVGIKNV